MALKEVCKFCEKLTVARRIRGFYLGSNEQLEIWECRHCLIMWSKKTKW